MTYSPTNLPTEKELQALLVESNDLVTLGSRLASFNILRVLRFEHGELRHSNILAWLLTPDESHGLGDRFLRRWLMRVLHENERSEVIRVIDVATADLRQVVVHREWGRLDLLIRIAFENTEWVVAIENKVRATQSNGQLKRYRDFLENTFPNAKRLLIFLTLHDESAEDPGWIETSYLLLYDVLRACRDELRGAMGAEPGVLVDHYLQTLKTLNMPDNDLIHLAQSIYRQHRLALDYIFEQIEDEAAIVNNAVEALIAETAKNGHIVPMSSSKGFMRFLPKAWDTPPNRAGNAWGTKNSSYLLCEIAWNNGAPRLKIVEGRAPSDWRKKLYELAQIKKGGLGIKRKMPAQWMSVYSKAIPVPKDSEPDELAAAIWDFVDKHITDPSGEFSRASKVLVDHLATLPEPIPLGSL